MYTFPAAIVAAPLLHDTPEELAQPSGIVADSDAATLESVNFCRQLTALKNTGNATKVSVGVTLPDGTVRTIDKSTVAALASIAPGATGPAGAPFAGWDFGGHFDHGDYAIAVSDQARRLCSSSVASSSLP